MPRIDVVYLYVYFTKKGIYNSVPTGLYAVFISYQPAAKAAGYNNAVPTGLLHFGNIEVLLL